MALLAEGGERHTRRGGPERVGTSEGGRRYPLRGGKVPI